ncbi:chymotrypsin/elastase isoinhibitor 1-like isoform X2 [Anoplophora glabripennis]|uniref:chymotrypsin/elastase isoinhibitor 1-like isoform X2 n=1 Tax=Anoplophora glabripennis TaxID=217634 RepID=UPI000C77BA30|nr:chymotrypsin/elastase isoinhibitor 1-like isoform X2 [Anoplophora glabripennis]
MKRLYFVVLLTAVVAVASAIECGPNEVYLLCQPCAAISCGDVAPEACIALCRNPGCYCDTGYLRKDGVCVPEDGC